MMNIKSFNFKTLKKILNSFPISSRKGSQQIWFIIIGAIIAILVAFFVISFFTKGGEKGTGTISKQLDNLDDQDKDGTVNMFDKCPCDPTITDTLPPSKKCLKECS